MMSDFDDVVNAIMRTSGLTDRARAERIAIANGHRRDVVDPEQAERDGNVLEKTEQSEVMKLFRAHGFMVYSLSQSRASKQTPGLPDLWVVHRELPLAFWFETKRQVGGTRSSAQLDFAAECERAHVGYAFGDRHAAIEQLLTLGIIERTEHGILEPVRRARANV
jgi:hypothetical protein